MEAPFQPPFDQVSFNQPWPMSYEKCYVELLQNMSFAGNLAGGMTEEIFKKLARDLNKKTNGRFTVDMLEDEFLRLKSRYRYFSLVLDQNGYYWCPFQNKVINDVPNWKDFVMVCSNKP